MDHQLASLSVQSAPADAPPVDLSQCALMDVEQVCAVGAFSRSYFLSLVAKKLAPQPLRFGSRCTRWKAVDIEAFMLEREKRATADAANEALMRARAKKASEAAVRKRRAAAVTQDQQAGTNKAGASVRSGVDWKAAS